MVSAQAEAGESKAGSRSAALIGAQSEAPGRGLAGEVVPVAGECGEERRGGVGVAGGGGVVAEQASDVGGRVSDEDELRCKGGGNWTAVLKRARSSTTRPSMATAVCRGLHPSAATGADQSRRPGLLSLRREVPSTEPGGVALATTGTASTSRRG